MTSAQKYLSGVLRGKIKNRQVIKDSNKVAIRENQPVYSKDKSRFFKTAWEVEKRQLFFD